MARWRPGAQASHCRSGPACLWCALGPPRAPVAQLDRALPSEGRGRTFESCRVRHPPTTILCCCQRHAHDDAAAEAVLAVAQQSGLGITRGWHDERKRLTDTYASLGSDSALPLGVCRRRVCRMSYVDQESNEYLDLPDDPEMAFAVLQQREYAALQRIWQNAEGSTRVHEQRYIDTLIAFDKVHNLGILADLGSSPRKGITFDQFFDNFRRHSEIASKKIKMEEARRLKTGGHTIIVLDTTAREAIHALINGIREKLNELTLPENKRETLFNKLSAFAAEVDRNRTRTEAFLSLAVDVARTARVVGEEIKPLQHTVDRVLDLIEKANNWHDALPPRKDRKKIEGPKKRLAPPPQDLDEEIPF